VGSRKGANVRRHWTRFTTELTKKEWREKKVSGENLVPLGFGTGGIGQWEEETRLVGVRKEGVKSSRLAFPSQSGPEKRGRPGWRKVSGTRKKTGMVGVHAKEIRLTKGQGARWERIVSKKKNGPFSVRCGGLVNQSGGKACSEPQCDDGRIIGRNGKKKKSVYARAVKEGQTKVGHIDGPLYHDAKKSRWGGKNGAENINWPERGSKKHSNQKKTVTKEK